MNLEQRLAAWQFRQNITQRADFMRLLADFISDGIPLFNAVQSQHHRFARPRGLARKPDSRALLTAEILQVLTDGKTFTQAVADWMPPTEAALIGAGEQASKLDMGLREAAYIAETYQKIKFALIAALAFPVILFAALAGILYMAANQLVPLLVQLVPLEKWPLLSYAYYVMAQVVTQYGLLIVAAIVLFWMFIGYLLPNWQRQPLRNALDNAPLFALYRKVTGAAFVLALSGQIKAGVPINSAVRQIRELASPWLASHCNEMLRRLGRGVPPGDAIDCGALDNELADRVAVYARLSSFSESIEKIARREVDYTLRDVQVFARLLNTTLFVCIGAVLIWTIFAFGAVVLLVSNGINPSI